MKAHMFRRGGLASRGQRVRHSHALLRLHEFPLLIGLVLTWMLLWREISVFSVLSGILVAILTMRMFYLPPVVLAGRFHLWWALRYLGYFLWHLILASAQVAWLAVRSGPPPRAAIIAVRLHTSSDFILTMVALTMSLIPGSLVPEVDRFGSTLYLHVLNTPTQRDIRRVRRQTRRIEQLLIRAVGFGGERSEVQ